MSCKKVYIKRHDSGGGAWIYQGYKNAWESLGYEASYFNKLEEISDEPGTYYLQIVDSNVNSDEAYQVVKNSLKTFVFAQPNSFPAPWGAHPNFQCHCPDKYIDLLNKLDNTFLWAFDPGLRHTKWKKVHALPIAFDSVAYKDVTDKDFAFDVCYIGGRADNGFDEKYQIMVEYFNKFEGTDIKCGIFVNQNISHEQENRILCNSKICLNIHDNYQKLMNTVDTNERTFKSLGCNGILISDREGYIPENFPDVPIFDTPEQMLELVDDYLNMSFDELQAVRDKHRSIIKEKHTYIERVKKELCF